MAYPNDFNSILSNTALSRESKRARLLGLLRGGTGGQMKKSLEGYLNQFKVDPFEVSKGKTRTWQMTPPSPFSGTETFIGGNNKVPSISSGGTPPFQPAQWIPPSSAWNNDNADLLVEGALTVSPERWAAILAGQADPLIGGGFKGQDVPKTVYGQERNPMWQQGANDFNSILSNPNLSLWSKRAKLANILNGGNGAEKKRFLNVLLASMGQQPVNSFNTDAYINAALRIAPNVWAQTLLPYINGTWQEFQYNR